MSLIDQPIAAATASPGRSTGAAILVVDDNAGKRLAIVSILEPLGHAVVEVESGEAALHAVMDGVFAVILMDVQMPIMDGYETARLIRMRVESEHTPIIFITSGARDEAQIPMAYASGAVDFIFAPLIADILRAKVSIFVELFRKSCELEQSLIDATILTQQVRDSEARAESVLANVADGIVTLCAEDHIESFNHAATTLFGYTEQEAIGQPISTMLAPSHCSDLANQGQADLDILAQQDSVGRPAEAVGLRQNGSTFPLELNWTELALGDRQIHIVCVRDISERQAYTQTLQYQALHDDLTGLPNRALFTDRVGNALRAAVRTKTALALMVMDLDEFKQVNDMLGHQHGDALLALVAGRIRGCLRDGDTLARLGGDEFGILPLGDTNLAGAATVAWKVEKALEPPFLVNNRLIDLRASIGISMCPEHGDNIADLLRRADLAMYDAKRSGSSYAIFAARQEEEPARRLALLGNLRRCIERDELVLHYQPKIDLATESVVGVEALIRWNHPSGTLVMPNDFIPQIEQHELMIPITQWVINEALRSLRQWRDAGYDLTIAVNIASRCMAERDSLLETVADLRKTWDIRPEQLTFELTESAVIDTTVPGFLARLQGMEERLSIDDFGTGFSSLKKLQQLPVCEIKADRSFVATMTTVKDDATIVRSIVDLAHNLGMSVVAEGVEDRHTMDVLLEYGCDMAQGYHFSRPLPRDDLTQWLQTSKFRPTTRLESHAASAVPPPRSPKSIDSRHENPQDIGAVLS